MTELVSVLYLNDRRKAKNLHENRNAVSNRRYHVPINYHPVWGKIPLHFSPKEEGISPPGLYSRKYDICHHKSSVVCGEKLVTFADGAWVVSQVGRNFLSICLIFVGFGRFIEGHY